MSTNSCFDSNSTTEFKCNCKDGFDGKRCEEECSLDCENNGICVPEFKSGSNSVSIKTWKCDCKSGFAGAYI